MSRRLILLLSIGVIVFVLALVIVLPRNNTTAPLPGSSHAPATHDPLKDVPIPSKNATSAPAEVAIPSEVIPPSAHAPGIRIFTIRVQDDQFSPAIITGHTGDTIRIEFTAVHKNYDFTQPALGLSNISLPAGIPKFVEFSAIVSGQFTYFCSSCGGPSKGPVGYIIIK